MRFGVDMRKEDNGPLPTNTLTLPTPVSDIQQDSNLSSYRMSMLQTYEKGHNGRYIATFYPSVLLLKLTLVPWMFNND